MNDMKQVDLEGAAAVEDADINFDSGIAAMMDLDFEAGATSFMAMQAQWVKANQQLVGAAVFNTGKIAAASFAAYMQSVQAAHQVAQSVVPGTPNTTALVNPWTAGEQVQEMAEASLKGMQAWQRVWQVPFGAGLRQST